MGNQDEKQLDKRFLSRRDFIRLLSSSVILANVGILLSCDEVKQSRESSPLTANQTKLTKENSAEHVLQPALKGEVDHVANGFNPTDILTSFDYGEVRMLPNGQTLHEYRVHVVTKEIEVAPGLRFSAWMYNGRIPGPTLRAREGDRVRIQFVNDSDLPHTMHFHGIHSGHMDGVFEQVLPGQTFTYEFIAEPFGVHLYHCHTLPLAVHIAKGLYGVFIIEPKQGWPKVDHEFVMMMHGYDTNFDGKNDFYAVNGIPFHYERHPIRIKTKKLVRIFLVNMLEYDTVNTFHLHANFFHYYPTGSSLMPSEYTDTIMLSQGQRGILEFAYKHPGIYMFHAHQTLFTALGWTGLFQVEEETLAR